MLVVCATNMYMKLKYLHTTFSYTHGHGQTICTTGRQGR